MVKYEIMNSGDNMMPVKPDPRTILKVIHNAGFFSMFTIRLMDIIMYLNTHGTLPDEVDSKSQFMHYKGYAGEDLTRYFLAEDLTIDINHSIAMPYDCMSIQFAPYSDLPFDQWRPILDAYFMPSALVGDRAYDLTIKYNIDYENACFVFYRGNDKVTETPVADYSLVIDKAREVHSAHPSVKFIVLPDEREFMDAFKAAFPGAIAFSEVGSIKKDPTTAYFYKEKREKRKDREAWYYAAVLLGSRCKHIITHSGNGALWAALYRGNSENIHQYFEGKWY